MEELGELLVNILGIKLQGNGGKWEGGPPTEQVTESQS